MEATLRPYDRGEEVTPFATLGLYHALPCPRALPSYAYPFVLLFLSYLLLGGAEGSEQKRVSQREAYDKAVGRAASAAYPARLNSQM